MSYLIWALPGKIFALSISIYFFPRLFLPYRLIFLQVLLAFIAECIGGYFAHYYLPNAWVFNIYNLTDFLLTAIVARLLLGKVKYANLSLLLIGIMACVWISEIYKYGLNHFATAFFTGACIVLVALYTWLFTKLMFTQKILNEPAFWLSISVILYFGCCMPFFGLHNYLVEEHYLIAKKLELINRVLNFLRYPLIGIGFLMAGKEKLSYKIAQNV